MGLGRGGENHKLNSSVRAFSKAFFEVVVGVVRVKKAGRGNELLGAEHVNPKLVLGPGAAVDVVLRGEE